VPTDQRSRLWAAYYQHLLDADRSQRTVTEYRRALTSFWDHAGKQPGRVGPADLRRFLARPTVPGGNARGPYLADSTKAREAASVRAFYRWATATRRVKRDPFAGMVLPRSRPGPPRDLPLEAITAIIDYTIAFPRVWLEVWLGYGAGLRVGEMAGLRIEDCDLSDAVIRVHGKGRRERLVPLHSEVARVLRLSVAGRPGVGPVLAQHAHPDRPCSRKTIGYELNDGIRAGLAAGRQSDPTLPASATAHQLRHSFATALAAQGVTERAIGLLLGHADPKTTRRYTIGFSRDAHEAVERLPIPGRAGLASPGPARTP
jgi:integrase/recombinase XerC